MMKKKSLPEELIVEMLVKLPVKSLLRFRCVCKSWFDLIKSPNFVEMHLKHHSTTKNQEFILIMRGRCPTARLMSFHSYESLSVILPHLQIPYFSGIVMVSGPSNGLLCISDGRTIVLCNPALREFKVLPPRPFSCPDGWEFSIEAIGFGFDSNTNDYKVVTFVLLYPSDEKVNEDDYVDKVEIYNLSNNSWREIDHDHDLPLIPYNPAYGTLFNGALHWSGSREGIPSILSFDFSTEVFRDMELPDDHLIKSGTWISLMVLNESLALFAYTDPYYDYEQFVDIWVMHEYGKAKSWTKQVSIGPLTRIYSPLLYWRNEAILIESREGLVSCALDTHETNDLEIHGDGGSLGVMVYQESLISIK